MSLKQELINEAAKAVPAGGTLTLSLFGVPLTQWAAVLSCIVLLTQLIIMLYNQWRKRDGKRDS